MSPAQAQQFEQFWRAYPRRVGKLAAQREWERRRPDLTAVLEALDWQRQQWTDPKFTPHPRTWLSQGRWMDEPVGRIHGVQAEDWWDECQRLHGRRCNGRHGHAVQLQLDAAAAKEPAP